MSELKRKFICFDKNMEQRVFSMRETAERHAVGAIDEYVLAPTQGADARPVAITEEHRTLIENAILALDEGVAPGSEHANDLRCVLNDLAARATPADHSVRDATLFDILMRRNIELTDEAYLSMRVVGVPPSEDEFVAALKKAIDAAIESQRSGNGESS